ESFNVLEKANLSVAQDGALGSPFTTYLSFTDFEAIKRARPAIGMIDVYPYNLQVGGNPTDNLLIQIPLENQKVHDFAAIGQSMLLLPQALVDRTRSEYFPVSAHMHTAQLGAAVLSGARGIIPFFYNSDRSYAQGMRGPELSSTAMLDAYREFNNIVERLEPLLLQLDIPELLPDTPYPFA